MAQTTTGENEGLDAYIERRLTEGAAQAWEKELPRWVGEPRGIDPHPDDDLAMVEFLTTRLDEDEGAAGWLSHRLLATLASGSPDPSLREVAGREDRRMTERVVREAAAKRAILAEHKCGHPVDDREQYIESEWCCYRCTTDFPCVTVRHLAAVYADHPDYDDAWRP